MLNTAAAVIVILWLLGYIGNYRMDGFIHILLVVALIMVVVNFIQSRGKKS